MQTHDREEDGSIVAHDIRNYVYPHEVLADPRLDADEKRAILSAWASDAYAVESFPALRHMPGTPYPVTLSAIMDARLRLDRQSDGARDRGNSPRPWAHVPSRARRLKAA